METTGPCNPGNCIYEIAHRPPQDDVELARKRLAEGSQTRLGEDGFDYTRGEAEDVIKRAEQKATDPRCATIDEVTPIDLDRMSNVHSLNMKMGEDKLTEALANILLSRRGHAQRISDHTVIASTLTDQTNAIARLAIRNAGLLEPIDAEHIGAELDWLLKQEGNVGAAAFQLMKAFAQKNAEINKEQAAVRRLAEQLVHDHPETHYVNWVAHAYRAKEEAEQPQPDFVVGRAFDCTRCGRTHPAGPCENFAGLPMTKTAPPVT